MKTVRETVKKTKLLQPIEKVKLVYLKAIRISDFFERFSSITLNYYHCSKYSGNIYFSRNTIK